MGIKGVTMGVYEVSVESIVEDLGQRLKQARLNKDLTQASVAEQIGVSRKTIVNAEKGKVHFETFVAIMVVLGLKEQLNSFLPPQNISPVQLAKLQGKSRQRASGLEVKEEKGDDSW
jgi:putative transcriptional regulator